MDPMHVNFQPTTTYLAGNYLPDTGKVFASRGIALMYGWDADNAANTRIRGSVGSPDYRYDSNASMQANGANRKWEMVVPNGRYEVRLVAGDATATDSVYKMNLEGQLALSGTRLVKPAGSAARRSSM
jgi:hypothetical protein